MKAVVLDHFSAEEVAEGRADSHCSGQGTLRQVEAAAFPGPICNHQNSDYAENCVRDAVEQLDGDQSEHLLGERVKESPKGKHAKAQQEKGLSTMDIGEPADRRGGARDDNLRDDDAGRHQGSRKSSRLF